MSFLSQTLKLLYRTKGIEIEDSDLPKSRNVITDDKTGEIIREIPREEANRKAQKNLQSYLEEKAKRKNKK